MTILLFLKELFTNKFLNILKKKVIFKKVRKENVKSFKIWWNKCWYFRKNTKCCQHNKKIKDDGHDVIAVVSAMSGETNKLIEYSEHFSKTPNKCEMDMLLSSGERVTSALLSIALNEQGYEAISMSGRQAGIVTDDAHTKARIEGIDTTSMKKAISDGKVVVVAGFQGVTEEGRVTTLGRGGSDLTAVAIAGAINADVCEIYTDVDGIYTTDPRIEPKAKNLIRFHMMKC